MEVLDDKVAKIMEDIAKSIREDIEQQGFLGRPRNVEKVIYIRIPNLHKLTEEVPIAKCESSRSDGDKT